MYQSLSLGATISIRMYYLEEYTELGIRVDSFVGGNSQEMLSVAIAVALVSSDFDASQVGVEEELKVALDFVGMQANDKKTLTYYHTHFHLH